MFLSPSIKFHSVSNNSPSFEAVRSTNQISTYLQPVSAQKQGDHKNKYVTIKKKYACPAAT